jgi:hypothetical protein
MPTLARRMLINEFNNAVRVDWRRPDGGAVQIPVLVHDGMPWFGQLNNIDVTLQDVGNFNCITDLAVNTTFGYGDSQGLLLAEYRNLDAAIHLHFNPPIKAIGVRITADGVADEPFLAKIKIEDDRSHVKFSVEVPSSFAVNTIGNGVPFVGIQGDVGEVISDAWFDVETTGLTSKLTTVALSKLWIIP